MGIPAEFLLEAFAGRSVAPVCILCLPNIRGAFPPKIIYTRDLAEAEAFVDKYDGPGAAIYFGANTTLENKKRNKASVAEIVTLHADLDFKNIAATPDIIEQVLRALPLPPSTIVDSGNGFHGYWRFREALPPELRERVEAALRRLAWALAGDPSVCEIARIMRLPGSHNTKDGAHKPVTVRWNSGRLYTLDELENWLAGLESPVLAHLAAAPKAGKNGNGGLPAVDDPFGAMAAEVKPIPIDVEAELDAMVFHGTDGNGVNLTQLRVIGSLLHEGISVDQAIDYVVEATWAQIPEAAGWKRHEEVEQLRDMVTRTVRNRPELLDLQEGGVPPWLTRRLGKTTGGPDLKAIFDAATGPKPERESARPKSEPAAAAELDYVAGEELEKLPVEPVKWKVENFVMEDVLNGLFGDGGTGKDYLLMQLGLAMACEHRWLGREVKPGRVLYFNVEDRLTRIRWRQYHISQYFQKVCADYPDRLRVVPMVGKDTILAVADPRTGLVKPTPLLAKVRRLVESYHPDLVIMGNRVNIFAVNQNDDAHARQCIELLNAVQIDFETTLIMPSHVSLRGLSDESGTSASGSSGTVQWSNGPRHRVVLSKAKKDKNSEEEDAFKRTLTVLKSNDAPTDLTIELRWSKTHSLFVADDEDFQLSPPQPEPGETEDDMKSRLRSELGASDDAMFLATLDRHSAMGSFVSASPTSHTNAPNIFSQDEECLPGVRMTEKKKRMKAAMKRLLAREVIETVQWDSPSKNKWRIKRAGLKVVK